VSPARSNLTLDRRLPAAIVTVLLLSLAVHAVVALQYRSDPFLETYISDALSYHEWAQRMVRDGLASEPVFHQSPLFPILLAALYSVSSAGQHVLAGILLQALLTSIALSLLVPLGRVVFGSTAAGVCAAALVLLHGPFVFYGLKLLPVSLALATQCAALLALTVARTRGGTLPGALAGLCLAFACLARSELILFLPFALIATGYPPEPSGTTRRWTAVVAFLLVFIAVLAPVTLHNARRGDFVLIASSGGENLYIGNQTKGSGGHTALHQQAGDLFSQRVLATKIAEEDLGRELRPSEVSAFWRRKALREVLDDPGGWLALELRKIGRLLHPGDPTDLYSYPLERSLYLTALHALPVTPWCLLLLGVVGAVAATRTVPRRVWPLTALLAIQVFVLLVFFVDSRLRLPVLFFCASFGGYAVVTGWRLWRSNSRRPWVLAIVAACALALVIGIATTRATDRDRVRLASILSMQQRLDESLEVLQPAIAGPDPDANALNQAGWVLEKKGEFAAARDRYLQALEGDLPPARACQTGTRLAIVHEKLGEVDLSAARHDATLASEHANTWNYYERGMFRMRQSDREGAIEDLREAVRLEPAWPPPRTALRSLGVPAP